MNCKKKKTAAKNNHVELRHFFFSAYFSTAEEMGTGKFEPRNLPPGDRKTVARET